MALPQVEDLKVARMLELQEKQKLVRDRVAQGAQAHRAIESERRTGLPQEGQLTTARERDQVTPILQTLPAQTGVTTNMEAFERSRQKMRAEGLRGVVLGPTTTRGLPSEPSSTSTPPTQQAPAGRTLQPEQQAAIREQRIQTLEAQQREWEERAGLVGSVVTRGRSRVVAGARTHVGAGKLAQLSVMRSTPRGQQQKALERGPSESVAKIGRVLDGAQEEVKPSDIAAFEQATADLPSRNPHLEQLRRQVSEAKTLGSRSGTNVVADVQSRPDFADMTPRDYRDAVEANIAELPPLQRAQARLQAEKRMPDAIREKEARAAQIEQEKDLLLGKAEATDKVRIDREKEAFERNLSDIIDQLPSDVFADKDTTWEEVQDNPKLKDAIDDLQRQGVLNWVGDEKGVRLAPVKEPKKEETYTFQGRTYTESQLARSSVDGATAKIIRSSDTPPTYETTTTQPIIAERGGQAEAKQVARLATQLLNSENPPESMDAALRSAAAERVRMSGEGDRTPIAASGEDLLSAVGNEAVGILQANAAEKMKVAEAARAKAADEYLDQALATQADIQNVAQGLSGEVDALVGVGESQEGALDVVATEVLNDLLERAGLEGAESQAQLAARERITGYLRDEYLETGAKRRAAAEATALEEERREAVAAEYGDMNVRWATDPSEQGASGDQPLVFDPADPKEAEMLREWDASGSFGRQQLQANFQQYKSDKAKKSSDAQQSIAQLAAGVPRLTRQEPIEGTSRTQTVYEPLETEQDWDEYQQDIINEYGGFPTLYSDVQNSFREAKEKWNQKVVTDLQAELKVDAAEAESIVDAMNQSNEAWLEKLTRRQAKKLEDIGAFDRSKKAKEGLIPDIGGVPENLQFTDMAAAEAANIPAGTWVVIGGQLFKSSGE